MNMAQPYKGSLPTSTVKKGSKGANVERVQTFLNWCMGYKLAVDGVCGAKTVASIKKYQVRYGLKKDGVFGTKSKKMAKHLIKKQPVLVAMRAQYEWSKKQKYQFNDHPTIANSKKEGTCITFVAVTCQRLEILPSGKYFYLNPKTNRIAGNGDDYVKKHTEYYKLFYPNKTIKQLLTEGKIMPYDMLGFDDPAYHSMFFAGFNSKGEPIFYSMGSNKKWGKTYSYYANRKVSMIVRIKKVG